jgi:FkbM family methyltransferase
MNNLFIDIGTHMGGGLLNFIKKYNMTFPEWDIHTFEPHPLLFKMGGENITDKQIGYPYYFHDINEALKLIPQINRHNAACSNFNGIIKLFYDKDLNENHMGNTIVKDVYENPNLTTYDPNRSSYMNEPIDVNCINIYEFILKITKNKQINNLVIKIDAEGAEFAILDKFLTTKKDKIFDVNNCDIYCEFHHFILNNPEKYKSVDWYKQELENKKSTLYTWG